MGKYKKRQLLYLTLFCLLMIALQGCHTMKFEIENKPPEKVVEDINWFFLFGWFPTHEIDVTSKCPAGAAAIKEQTSVGDGLIEILTIWIVSPRSTTYYCLPEKKQAALPLQEVQK